MVLMFYYNHLKDNAMDCKCKWYLPVNTIVWKIITERIDNKKKYLF